MQELSIPEQIAVWDRIALAVELTSLHPDGRVAALVGEFSPHFHEVLDLGCGCGRHLLALAEAGWYATGLDWSLEALGQARRALSYNNRIARLIKGDFRHLPSANMEYDLIIASRVLNHCHLNGFVRALHELKRVLKTGGRALVSLPGRANAPQLPEEAWVEPGTAVLQEGMEAGIPHHFFTVEEIEAALPAFHQVQIETVQEPLPPGAQPLFAGHVNEWHWVTLCA